MTTWFNEVQPQANEDVLGSFGLRETPLGEYLDAKASEGFDYTTTGRFMDERRVSQAEEAAYGKETRPQVNSGELVFADPAGYENLTKTDRPILPKDEWEKSENFRPGIKYEKVGEMTPVRAKILAEDYDERRYRDSLIERSPVGARSILGFGAGMIGSLPDPVNLVGFGAVGAGRTLTRAALIGAAENVAATMLTDAVVLPDLAARGEDVGFKEFVMDNMFAAALGGLFGLGGQALKNATDSARLRAHVTERQVLADSLEKATMDVSAGRSADVREMLRLEEGALGRLYDEALLHPLGGDSKDANVRLTRESFADDVDRALADVFVDKGSGKARADGSVTFDAGYGLVKIIWKHGEESDKAPALRVSRDDVLAFPGIIKEYEPTLDKRHGGMEWVVQREDGRQVIYGVTNFTATDGENHLVTVHVPGPGNEKATLSSRLNPVEASGSPSELFRPIRDTSGGASTLTPPRAEDLTAQASKNIATGVASVKGEVTPHRATVEAAVAPFVENAPGAAPTRIINAKDIPPDKAASAARLYPGQEIIHEGWTDHRTGEVVLVADHLTPERAAEVWMHEQVGHHGLRKVFGDKSEMGLFLDAVAERYGHTGPNSRYMAEEEIARVAEKLSFGGKLTDEERSTWSQLVEAVRAWLVRHGLAEVSDKDIHRVLQESLAQVRKGEEKPQAKPGVVQFGEPKPEKFSEPAEILQREKTAPEASEQAMAAHIDALQQDGKLREIDHVELAQASEASSRAEQYGEHLMNIAECAAKVVS